MNVAFIGAGLIGGSLLLRLRRGVVCETGDARAAIRAAGVAERVTDDWREAVRGADLVVLATPLDATLQLLPQILAACDAVVIDCCSVKEAVHRAAGNHPRFVGGHPMFGSEGQGFAAANAAFVDDATFILTKTEHTDAKAFATAEAFVRELGAVACVRSPREHDLAMARVSQLPQLTAWALALAVGGDPDTLDLSGPGLRDTTRLAASPPELWTPLLTANKAHTSDAVDALIAALLRVKDALDDPPQLQQELALARTTKRSWPLVRAGRLADRVAESSTGAMLAEVQRRTRAGETILPLHVGEPRLPPSPATQTIVRAALHDAPIVYTQTAGMPELRARITELSPIAGEPIVTTGAKQAIHLALASLLAPGDEVLIPEPSWVSFKELVRLAGGRPVPVATTTDCRLDPDAFADAITSHTRAVIFSTPNNPTGAVYRTHELDAVLEECARHDLWVISDELYRSFVFAGAHVSPLERYARPDRSVLIDGIAKSHGMTGLRVGWAVAPKPVTARMIRLASHETSCAPSVSQHAALALLREQPNGDPSLVAAVKARRAQLLASGLECGPMEGAFYAWIPGLSASDLLARGVAVMPGAAFGRDGFVRVSYAVPEDVLARALRVMTQ